MEESDEADGEVAQGGHDLGSVAGAQLVAVLVEDDVAHPVEPVLYLPMSPDPDLYFAPLSTFPLEAV